LSFRQHRRNNRKTCGSQGVRSAQEKIAFDYFRFNVLSNIFLLDGKGFSVTKAERLSTRKDKSIFYYFFKNAYFWAFSWLPSEGIKILNKIFFKQDKKCPL
jgi:hypothetical protein